MSDWLTPTTRPISIHERLFGGDSRLYLEFHDYTIHGSASMFYAVGRERGASSAARYHHGSIEDPALLGAYRDAVAGRTR